MELKYKQVLETLNQREDALCSLEEEKLLMEHELHMMKQSLKNNIDKANKEKLDLTNQLKVRF
jgi:hypothetical protein